MLIGKNYHLTYCANVHPGESWAEAFQQLKNHLPKIKASVSPQKPFGTGLYLSDKASREILSGAELENFKHVHIHVFAKPHDLPKELMGGKSFEILHVSAEEAAPKESVAEFCELLRKIW